MVKITIKNIMIKFTNPLFSKYKLEYFNKINVESELDLDIKDKLEVERILNLLKVDKNISLEHHKLKHLSKTKKEYVKNLSLNDLQIKVLRAILIGNGSIIQNINKLTVNYSMAFAYTIIHMDLIYLLYFIFQNWAASLPKVTHRVSKGNPTCNFGSHAKPILKEFRDQHYIETTDSKSRKRIPTELKSVMDPFVLAIIYQSRTYTNRHNYIIPVYNYSIQDIELLAQILLDVLELKTTIRDNYLIINKSSRPLFKELVSPYLVNSNKHRLD